MLEQINPFRSTFALAGWVFADLLLVFAILFFATSPSSRAELSTASPVSASAEGTMLISISSGVITPMAGACVRLDGTQFCDNDETDGDATEGVILIDGLAPGTYSLSPDVPNGFQTLESMLVTVHQDEEEHINFVLVPNPNATAEPTAVPTDPPTAEPTVLPTDPPTAEPTVTATPSPTIEPTSTPEPVCRQWIRPEEEYVIRIEMEVPYWQALYNQQPAAQESFLEEFRTQLAAELETLREVLPTTGDGALNDVNYGMVLTFSFFVRDTTTGVSLSAPINDLLEEQVSGFSDAASRSYSDPTSGSIERNLVYFEIFPYILVCE